MSSFFPRGPRLRFGRRRVAWGGTVGSGRVCLSPLSLVSDKWEKKVVGFANDSLICRLLEDTA